MATAKQIEANRRNAQKSTGPKTAEGKYAVKFNALVHGLQAKHLALPNESVSEVQGFVDAIIEAIAPRDAVEAELACEIATLSWKLRRAERLEHAVLSKRMMAMESRLAGPDEEQTEWNIEIATYDDTPEGHRRRRYVTSIRNALARARKELRLWQDAHPDPAPQEEATPPDEPETPAKAEDTPEIGFVRQEPIPSPESPRPVAAQPGSNPQPRPVSPAPVPIRTV